MAYETVNSETVYQGNIIDVSIDTIKLPDGRAVTREIVKRGGAAAVVPIDKDGKIIFVRQYRHPAKTMALEIPAGMIDPGEQAIDCAYRELEEETGYKTAQLTGLTEMYMSIGFCTEKIAFFMAANLEKGEQHLDADEFIEIERYTMKEAIEMVFTQEIVDAKTIAGILLAKAVLDRQAVL